MEMNTRLQVEHPVTEMVTGLDLVEQQLRVAAGEPLAFTQDDVRLHGHSVEVRVYAEDPARGFLPTGGRVLALHEASGEGVRVDSSLLPGGLVGTTYDPMLSKVVAWGADRTTALARLDRALAQTAVLGFGTNVGFLRSLLQHPDVRSGALDTGLVERELDGLLDREVPADVHVAYALHRLLAAAPAGDDPWDTADGWRPSGAAETCWDVAGPDGDPARRSPSPAPPTPRSCASATHEPRAASAHRTDDGLLLTVDGRTTTGARGRRRRDDLAARRRPDLAGHRARRRCGGAAPRRRTTATCAARCPAPSSRCGSRSATRWRRVRSCSWWRR